MRLQGEWLLLALSRSGRRRGRSAVLSDASGFDPWRRVSGAAIFPACLSGTIDCFVGTGAICANARAKFRTVAHWWPTTTARSGIGQLLPFTRVLTRTLKRLFHTSYGRMPGSFSSRYLERFHRRITRFAIRDLSTYANKFYGRWAAASGAVSWYSLNFVILPFSIVKT